MTPSRPPHPPGGFTMLEIMIVIAVAGLVMATSIPFVQHTVRRDAVYTAVKVVDEACRNARALAIFNNTTTELVIHPHEKSFSVRPGTSRGGPIPRVGNEPRPPSNHSIKPYSGHFADDVTIDLLDVNFIEHRDAEEATVRFQPNGTADEFTIFFRIGTIAARKITLDIVTGLPALEVIR